MDRVIIKKDDIYAVFYGEDGEEIVENIRMLDYQFPYYLPFIVEVEDDVTIEDFLTNLYRHENIINIIFEGQMGSYKLSTYYNNMLLDPVEKRDDLKEIEFHWAVDIYDNEYSDYCSYHAYSKESGSGEFDQMPYSLSLDPLYNWKHLNLKLNEEYIVDFYDLEKKERIILWKGKKLFTLYDLISGFLYELTFNGSPEEQSELNELLEDSMEEVYELLDSMKNGEYDLISNDSNLKILKNKLEDCIKNENYEKAKEIHEEILKLTNKNIEE